MRGIVTESMHLVQLLAGCRFRLKFLVVLGLVFLALSPVLELYLVKLLADFILNASDELTLAEKLTSVFQIFGLLVIVYSLRYTVKVGRISFVNHLMARLREQSRLPSPWLRAALIEQTQIFAVFIQLIAMAVFCFYVQLWLGISFIVAFFLSYCFSNWLFLKQLFTQRKFRFNKKDSPLELGSRKVFERVRAQELASVFASFTAALLLFALLIMVAAEIVPPVEALVGLFLVRLYNITLGMFSGSVMRMARALAYVDTSKLAIQK